MKTHRPPQVHLSGETTYFITGRTYGGIFHLFGDEKKEKFKSVLLNKVNKYSARLTNWVVLENHYHLLIKFEEGLVVSRFVKELHGASSFEIKKLPALEVLNDEQIAIRELTPIEKRYMEKEGRGLKSANIISSCFKDIPFWYSYFSHVIRSEEDYFKHFNYIVQNPVKHGLVKNPWDYKFSGIFEYEREYIIDSLRDYPIIDFGGNYD